jgi:hypothetical protein
VGTKDSSKPGKKRWAAARRPILIGIVVLLSVVGLWGLERFIAYSDGQWTPALQVATTVALAIGRHCDRRID